jgi:hypothetical protein
MATNKQPFEFDRQFFNKNFSLTFAPAKEKIKPILVKKKASLITIDRLYQIAGVKKADFLIKSILKMKCDKKQYKVSGKGILYVAVK